MPYSAEAYFAQIGQYHQAAWLIQWLLPVMMLLGLAIAFSGIRHRTRLLCAILVSTWLWIGAVFHYHFFAGLNFAAPFYAGLFILQGVLLAESGVVRGQLELADGASAVGNRVATRLGLAMLLAGPLLYPLADWLAGISWQQLRWPGLAPTPTAIFTLGMLSLAKRAPVRLYLVPVFWLLLAAASGWVLGISRDTLFVVLTMTALVFIAQAKRRPG